MSAFSGDWLLAFHFEPERLPSRNRGTGWRRVRRGAESALWECPGGELWGGAPWIELTRDDWTLWLMGERYPLAQSADPEGLWAAVDEDDPSELNGHFLLLAHHRESGRWHLWTDRFGTFHAYYSRSAGMAAVGTYMPAVATASRRRLDWHGLTGFFACGFFLGDRTHFEDVKILRPACHYVFGSGGDLLSCDRYWQWRHEPDERRAYDETIDAFSIHLGEVVSDLAGTGRVALPISGGLDSRSTVAALSPSSESPHRSVLSYSYGYGRESIETRPASRIARVRSLPFRCFHIEPYLFSQIENVADCVEGFQDLTQCRQAAVTCELAPLADFVIAAHWGDVWLDKIGVVDGESDDPEILSHVLGRLLKKGRRWLLEHICLPQLAGSDPLDLVREEVRRELAAYGQIDDVEFRVKAFKTDQWSFRWTTASLRAFQPAAFPRLPFYDARLTDFFATVPSRFMRRRQLQIDYLKKYAPELARITWDAWDANLYLAPYAKTWLLPKRAAKKLWRLAVRKRVVERNWEVQFAGEAGHKGLEHWLLKPERRLLELVSAEQVRQLLEGFYACPDAARGYTVSMLLTFSVWLERHG
ncbi:MAG: hypothetical protein GY719_10920 [bacterium]|nr:hypothetical protein [bacterium]